ncbi:MAG: hypothetical protein GTO63_30220 [Anaerolineae bacterium]|nr:hypothetical protein [Anaerolineae bacterium]NIN98981.1 hypothetical protein [Anaerolineae bacterium]
MARGRPKDLSQGKNLTRKGVVEEITTRESEELSTVEVRHGAKPKKGKDGFAVGPFPETSRVKVPKEAARSLRVGQNVNVGVSLPMGAGQRQMRV